MAGRAGSIPGGVRKFWASVGLQTDSPPNAQLGSILFSPLRVAYYPTSMRGWIQAPIQAAAQAPFRQQDWPLPSQPRWPLWNIGRVRRGFAAAAVTAPVIPPDWPLPKTPYYSVSQRGWIGPAT